MNASLHLTKDGQDHPFPCGEFLTIGRDRQNAIALDGKKVSRSHAMVRCMAENKYFLVDMGSTNGTLVNNRRVLVPWSLSDGDQIKIGEHTLVFHQAAPPVSHATSPTLVGEETLPSLGGMIREITVLVTDIRDYTSLSEQTPADLLAQVLGRWFRASNEIVEKHGGIVDKFIGDAVMARWLSDSSARAHSVIPVLRAVHEMSLLTRKLGAEFPQLPLTFRIGAGVNTGEAVLGNVGANCRRDYTALGDAVNLAFRFESASKELKKDLVLGQDSYQSLPASIWKSAQRSITVKGKDKPLDVLALSFDDLGALLTSGPLATAT